MRAAFVNNLHGSYGADAINAPAFTGKVAKYALQGLCFPANGDVDAATLDVLRGRQLTVWSLRDPSWNGLGPVSLARAQFADLVRLAPGGGSLTLCADIEQPHDPNYIIAWQLALRVLVGPSRRIVWTLEGHQGGWFSADLVALVNSDRNWIIVPQQYISATSDWGTVDAVRADITSRGVNPAQVKIAVRAGDLSPATFPDGLAWTLDEGAPWGLP